MDVEVDPEKILQDLRQLSRNLHVKAMEQTKVIAEQAFDTSFPGITSEALGTAFATLSTTPNGKEFVVDNEGIKRHLAFVETVRNIPIEYVVAHPLEAYKKIVSEFYKAEYAF